MKNSLENVLAEINKKFGKGTIMSLGEQAPVQKNLLSSGLLMIDKILGGGIAYGRITELYGLESSGKSTMSLQFAAQCQKEGGTVAYVDVENSLDVTYAKKIGVDTDKLIFTQPSSGEQALEIVDMLASSGNVNLIIVDSVAALTPQAELDGEMSDQNIGLLARLMSRAMRKITGTLNEKNCAVIFINQIREKVNTGFSIGNNEVTTGGKALKFAASQRIELRKTTAIKNGDQVIGNNVKIKIVKNKIAPPMKVAEVPMIFGEGFSAKDELIDLAVEYDLISKTGAWFTTHTGERLQGKEAVKAYYKQNTEAAADLREKVKAKLNNIEILQQYEVDPETGEVIM